MANASGPALQAFNAADFLHAASRVHYRITEEGDRVWLNYERNSKSPDESLHGRQELRYFIGSGKRGRTYLFEQQGYWFESPINWYAKKQVWDMAPNLQSVRQMPLTMKVDPGCLHCHASNVARSLPEARNLYGGEPFNHSGITCVACHGDASLHIASTGKIRMLDIDVLEPQRRDSVCLNCHLEGQTAVVRKGRELEDFEPGDNLFDFASYFALKGESGSDGRAASQWEALLHSECKKKRSGDRLTCTTCHDPHGSPSAEEKAAFYRQRCTSCHNERGFAEKHHPENPDCIACHMARSPSTDIAHEQVTDHLIRKRIASKRPTKATERSLEPIGGSPADDRDLGLAYVQMAVRGDRDAAERAVSLLQQAERREQGARSDHELHAQLGFLEQQDNRLEEAAEEYRIALESDPFDSVAGGDLALLEVRRHQYAEAIRLWKAVFDHDPSELTAGMNLAIVECGLHDRKGALSTLGRILEFAPDEQKARRLLEEIQSGIGKCGGT